MCVTVLHVQFCTNNQIGYWKNHISAVFFAYQYLIRTVMKKGSMVYTDICDYLLMCTK